jgi:hypothetical protein
MDEPASTRSADSIMHASRQTLKYFFHILRTLFYSDILLVESPMNFFFVHDFLLSPLLTLHQKRTKFEMEYWIERIN